MKDHLIGQDIDGAMSGISGGERRRVSVGISLVMGAAAIFLDEPTTGLDSESAETLMALLARLARNRGKTVRAPHACRVLDQERLITDFDETLMARLALNRDTDGEKRPRNQHCSKLQIVLLQTTELTVDKHRCWS